MSLMIRHIVENQLLKGVRMVAGFSGENNIITWVNVMEILDSPDSVQRGELLVTTGYNLQNQELFSDLILTLRNIGVSGIAIQTGYYIEEIPQYIINECDRLGFPLLEVPKNLTFSEILRILIQKINAGKLENEVYNEEAKSLFRKMHDTLKNHPALSTRDDVDQSAYLIYLQPVNQYPLGEATLLSGINRIKTYLNEQSDTLELKTVKNGAALFLVILKSENRSLSLIYDFGNLLTSLSEQQGINYYAGIDRIKSIKTLSLAFEHITECTDMLTLIRARRGICSYDNISFIKMLGVLHQRDHSFASDNQTLQILINYDRITHSNYVQTLSCYLEDNCNASLTASRLFIHRHTLQKRLDKIHALCGFHSDDYYSRLYMSISLLIHNYFAY